MKTVKLIFSIALITLATAAFGQPSFSEQDLEKELIKASYTVENNKMTYLMDQPEVVYEEVYSMESWMRHPFDSNVPEMQLQLESWMTKPFNCNYGEADLPVESWMKSPFGTTEFIEVERWMTTAWL